MRNRTDIKKILDILDREYPNVRCSLNHQNPLQLLTAVILSAQCTDERVNQVTKDLFAEYQTARNFAEAPLEDLEEMVRPTGFYRNKAKNIKNMAKMLVEKHQGRVPSSLEELVELPGVGRKTANVVLATAFGIPGVTVDTHVGRISRRLGITDKEDPVAAEFDIMEQIPREKWDRFSLQLINHGRSICKARKPDCPDCPLLRLCPTGQEQA